MGDGVVRSTAATMWSYRLLDAACSARPLALLNYGAMPPLQAAALLCTSGRRGAYRLFEEPKRSRYPLRTQGSDCGRPGALTASGGVGVLSEGL